MKDEKYNKPVTLDRFQVQRVLDLIGFYRARGWNPRNRSGVLDPQYDGEFVMPYDHSNRTTKHNEPLLGECRCEHCEKLPWWEPPDKRLGLVNEAEDIGHCAVEAVCVHRCLDEAGVA